jgi:hypothetical protein
MKQVPINSFSEVILFEMQRNNKTYLDFSEIWRICERSKVHKHNVRKFAKPFVREMMQEIRTLAIAGMINTHTKDGGERIYRITLTKSGIEFLECTIFTNQQMMGDPA